MRSKLCSSRLTPMLFWLGWLLAGIASPVWGQVVLSPSAARTNHTPTLALSEPAVPASNQLTNNRKSAAGSEQIRTECINGRRHLCGRVLQIAPDGIVVESGYTNLLRPELSRSWIARSNVSASRPADLVEANTPGAVCVGLVFLTGIPKRPAVKLYDYVILEAYPAGHYVYSPVPNVKKDIRRFSAELLTAIKLNLESSTR